METILIIDDEEDLVEIIKDSLEEVGYEVLVAYNGSDGIALSERKPDLIILDIMMKGLDGYEVCLEIRDKIDGPIIFLSAKSEESSKLRSLKIGGDDYITKPFSLKELLARVETHLRREKRLRKDEGDFIKFKGLSIDLKGKVVSLEGKNLALTNIEYKIVELLALNPRQVFSKDQIYDKVWGYDGQGTSLTVTEHIKKIRAKIGDDYIKTIWGIGYRWME